MPNFITTHYLMLQGAKESPRSLQWDSVINNTAAQTVTDVGVDGILTENSDSYIFGSTFSGWYVSVGGQNFGIFNSGAIWVIPYNADEFNLGFGVPIAAEIASGTTTLFSAALHGAANCFLTGTRIATPTGPRAIETLRPDDLVLTADGRAVPIVWVWHQEIVNIRGLSEGLAPILISAGAFGPCRPLRYLIVTADHAMLLDGVLINAVALVNDVTIRLIPATQMPARYRYWHIETSAHEVLLAENCATESYVDYAMRRGFDNYDAYLARYGHDRPIPEMTLPRIGTARLLPPHRRAMPMVTSPA